MVLALKKHVAARGLNRRYKNPAPKLRYPTQRLAPHKTLLTLYLRMLWVSFLYFMSAENLNKRRGGGCRSCVIGRRKYSHVSRVSLACFSHVSRVFLTCFSRFAHVLLTFCSRAPAFCRLKAHGIPFVAQCGATFLPFYSAEIGCLSEKRSQVAQPQHETRISIENGNAVARPPCQTFHLRILIVKGNAVARPPCNNFHTALY